MVIRYLSVLTLLDTHYIDKNEYHWAFHFNFTKDGRQATVQTFMKVLVLSRNPLCFLFHRNRFDYKELVILL
jgi:hypothetical protein